MKFKCISSLSTNHYVFGIPKTITIPNITIGKTYYGGLIGRGVNIEICFYNDNKKWDYLRSDDKDCFAPVED